MVQQLPKPDLSRFSPISPEIITLSYLSCMKQGISLATLQKRLDKFVATAEVGAAVAAMIERGEASMDNTIKLTAIGRDVLKKQLGSDVGQKWDVLKSRRLPLIALGLDPLNAESRKKVAGADALKAAAIAVAFGLPKDGMTSTKAVCGELIWRLLRAGIPEVVGNGPFPPIDKLATVERVLLAGLAGVKAKTIPDAITGVASMALGLEKADADALRERLIMIGVERAASSARSRSTPRIESTFATRVKDVAARLSTPPFQGRVAIAQVYDAYGKVHSDAVVGEL